MIFRKSKSMKVSVLPEQEKFLSAKSKIEAACSEPDIIALDIYRNEELIGFAMMRQFEEKAFFLWDYAIDYKYQNKKYGTIALTELIDYMVDAYKMSVMTTTYIWGNEQAKRMYEKVGFTETDIVDEEGCHEVNMIYVVKDIDKDI